MVNNICVNKNVFNSQCIIQNKTVKQYEHDIKPINTSGKINLGNILSILIISTRF